MYRPLLDVKTRGQIPPTGSINTNTDSLPARPTGISQIKTRNVKICFSIMPCSGVTC
ncbi:hypothetical protein LSH36_57g04050 [Paralvinella palmiformis]|uniref:Uncharacterized protein n=1 Tax=Paralvinella palmiformis TaxID=53620 RepID=A0AAD9K4U3_9ANNE|nr:hypothetical protein LSH36_57g04050 [Paralvinella palmiformis]